MELPDKVYSRKTTYGYRIFTLFCGTRLFGYASVDEIINGKPSGADKEKNNEHDKVD